MTNPVSPAADKAWAMIEKDKRFDRFIRRVSIVAWSVTLLIVLLFTIMIGSQVAELFKAARANALPWTVVIGSAMPLIIVLGFLSLLIATLTTIGIFLRMRTASLAEIQLRLAALEDMLASRPGGSL
jgi:hypothetical protein